MNVNTNQSDLWLQMLQTAAQIAQSTIPAAGESSGGKDSGSDFKTMLEDKRTQAAQKPTDPQTEATDQTEKLDQGAEDSAQAAGKTEEETMADLAQIQAALQASLAAGVGIVPSQEPQPQAEAAVPVVPVVEASAPEVSVEAQAPVVETAQPVMTQAVPVQETAPTQPIEVPNGESAPTEAANEPVQTVQPTQPNQEEGGSELPTQTKTSGGDESQFEVVQVKVQAEQPVFQEVKDTMVKVGDGATLDTTQEPLDTGLQQRITKALDQGMQKVEVRLTPENLGTVTIELTQAGNGALHVVLRAENEQTVRLLQEHSGTLGLLLQENSQSQVQVEVPQARSSEQPWQYPDQGGERSGQQGRQQQGRSSSQEGGEDFLHQLRLGLIQAE